MSVERCMLAEIFDPDRVVYPCAFEDKIDGLRVFHGDGEGSTRNGNTYETWRVFSEMCRRAVPAAVKVDTEMAAPTLDETKSLLKRKLNIDHEKIRERVVCYVFDVWDSDVIASAEPYTARRKAVEWVVSRLNEMQAEREHRYRAGDGFDVGPLGLAMWGYRFEATPLVICYSPADLEAAFAAALERKHEGGMIKTLGHGYKIGRSWAWMKRKLFKDITVTVAGMTHGHGLCPSCMTIDRRRERAAAANAATDEINRRAVIGGHMKTITEDDVKPLPGCPTCGGAATGVPRPDILGALKCVDADGREWDIGMGFSDADKVALFTPETIGKKVDVKIQGGASEDKIAGRHGVYMGVRDDI